MIKQKSPNAGKTEFLPNNERTPQPVHTIRDNPTDSVWDKTPFGDIKMPDPVVNENEK